MSQNERLIMSLFISKPYEGSVSVIRCYQESPGFTGGKHFGIKAPFWRR